MLKNDIYIGSVKDTDGIWHPVISSPSEDIVAGYIERMTTTLLNEDGDDEANFFWTEDYTIELLPIVVEDNESDSDDEEEWTNQWEPYDLDDEDWSRLGQE